MKLSDLLDEHVVTVNLKARNQHTVLEEMVGILKGAGKIKDHRQACKALGEREAAGSTAVGKGIAFPHARIEGLTDPVAVLAISERGVQFRSGDNREVFVFFLFLTPIEKTELHLQILSKATAVFSDIGFYHAVRKAKSRSAVLQFLANQEKGGKEAFYPLPIEDIFKELGTGFDGLTDAEAAARLERYGPNVLRAAKGKSLTLRFLENLTNLFAVLLWVGGFLSFIAGMPELGWAIFVVILVNALFSFWQEFRAERALDALKKLIPQKARVMRGGSQREVAAQELVPGDVTLIDEGDAISADARLIEASALRVDNSALTGESKAIHKTSEAVADGEEFLWTEFPNLVFAGTSVSSGHGKAAVIATGMHTEIGRIASLTQDLRDEKSPLQREIEKVIKIVAIIAVFMGVLFFILGTVFGNLGAGAAFLFAIGIIVANVPEGLLPTVSLSLAMAAQRMARRNVLIKRLSSVETLGCTTVICSDKTGTLTTGELTVTKIFLSGKQIDVGGDPQLPTGTFTHQGAALSHEEMERTGLYRLFDAALLCNNAALHSGESTGRRWSVVGDPTEGALLVMAARAGFDIPGRTKALPRTGHLPFEAVRKRMTSVNLMNGQPVAHVKGAPAEMLDLCGQIMRNGNREPMTEQERLALLSENDALAREGLRVLALAERPLDFAGGFTVENTEKDLVFLGLVGMVDPPRLQVPPAVSLCRRAGIRVVMITGDYGLTALAVARKVGMAVSDGTCVITGRELSEMNEESLKEVVRQDVIFARTTPEHKMRIVSALQAIGEVVAVTGDGVNDAPALKKADIGVAMGIRGSDVAKESAAVILTDDNFASIVSAIEEGRAVYANIKKFVTYIFSSNIPELVPFIAFVLFRIPLPLTVMQILAVDLGTDLVPALGLGTERPEAGTMDRPPRPRSKRLLDAPLLLRAYGFLGPLEAVGSMAAFYLIYWQSGWRPGMDMAGSGSLYSTATTMCFAAIVAAQIGNVLACRTERESVFRAGLIGNRLVMAGIVWEFAILIALMYTPFLQQVFGLAPLSLWHWTILAAITPVPLIFDETRKFFNRRHRAASAVRA